MTDPSAEQYPPPPPDSSQGGPPAPYQPGGPLPAPLQQDETMWAVLAHLSLFVLSLIGPLVIILIAGQQRPFARANAVEALNFHLTLLFAFIVCVVLMFVLIGFVLAAALGVAAAVLAILAAVAAGRGEGYRYPLTLRLVH
ncbi:MAG: DUF4870 domain-containing protein [Actinomycetes bacterium]